MLRSEANMEGKATGCTESGGFGIREGFWVL